MPSQTLTIADSSPWTTPTGAFNLAVKCKGGGGAGGNSDGFASGDSGSGGGGGAYAYKLIALPASSYAFEIGQGGSPGNDGGNTSFGIVCIAEGGQAGATGSGGGRGGRAVYSTGDIVYSGGAGWDAGENFPGGGGGESGSESGTGTSATSYLGATGTAGGDGGNGGLPHQNGSNGAGYGGGAGGGCHSLVDGIVKYGGTGGYGVIELTWEMPAESASQSPSGSPSLSPSPSISPSNSPSPTPSASISPSPSPSNSPSLSPSPGPRPEPGEVINPQIMMQFSDDGGYTWSNENWQELGYSGDHQKRIKWHRLGRSKDRVFKVVITDPVPVVLVNAYIDLEAGTTRR